MIQQLNFSGTPGAHLSIFAGGKRVPLFMDSGLTVAACNPIAADPEGRYPPVWYDDNGLRLGPLTFQEGIIGGLATTTIDLSPTH